MAFNFLDPIFRSGGKKEYGTKPVVPDAIDYSAALKSNIATNKEILPSLTELGLMSTDSLNQLIERLMPGATELRDTITSGYTSLAKGEIPADVERSILQREAQGGVGRGTTGSIFDIGNREKTLDLTSLQLSQEGRQAGGAWYSALASRAYDPTKMFLSTQDSIRQSEFNWQRDYLAAEVNAAPDPVARGRLDTGMGVLGMALGMYSGAAPVQRYQPNYSSPGAQQSRSGEGMFGSSYAGGYNPNSYNPEFDVGAGYNGGGVNPLGAKQEAFDMAF